MDEQTLNRRQILGGMAAAGATGLLGACQRAERPGASRLHPMSAPRSRRRSPT